MAAQKPLPKRAADLARYLAPYKGWLVDQTYGPRRYGIRVTPPGRGGQPVEIAIYETESEADRAVERVIKELSRRKRNCLTCGKPFMSEGPGHRLCDEHRRSGDDTQSFPIALRKAG